MRNKLLNYLYTIANWSPLLHISCDEHFGRYDASLKLRLSALALSLGKSKLYIITLSNAKWSLFHLVQLDAILKRPNQTQIDLKASDYYNDISSQSRPDEEIALHYEFLKEAYNNNTSTRSSLETKVSSHASTYLILAGFYAYVFNELWKIKGWQGDIALGWFLLSLPFLASTGYFIFNFFQVGGVVRASFREIKPASKATQYQQAKGAYINWFSSMNENQTLATYVKNIETNMVTAFLLVAMLWIFVFFSGNSATKEPPKPTNTNFEFAVVDEAGSLNKKGISQLLNNLHPAGKKKDTYYIISSTPPSDELYSSVLGFIKAVAGSDRVVELKLDDSSRLGSSIIVKIKGENPL